jgi:anti-anti-sigma factor
MKITVLPRNDEITQIALEGRLDTTAVEEIGGLFHEAAAKRERPAIVDLSQVVFMASSGIGMLLASSKELKKHGHKLVLLAPQKLVDESLRTTRIDLVMPIAYELEEAARLALGGTPAAKGSVRRESPSASQPLPASAPAKSAPKSSNLTLAIRNELSDLKRVNEEVTRFLHPHGVAPRATYAVNLAIDELVTNVIRYAYVDDDPHTIGFQLALDDDQIVMQINDDGRPFDPRTGPALDLHADERQVGGLGLILVLDMVDSLKYRRTGEQNHVEVRIRRLDEVATSAPVVAGDFTTTI